MTVISSFPNTLPAYELPKTHQVEIGADNVQLTLAEGSRSFNTGDIVQLSDYEFDLITQASFDEGYVIDRGRIEAVGGDDDTFAVQFDLSLPGIEAGDVVAITPGFAGTVVGWRFIVTDPVVTASDEVVLTLEIDSTVVQTTGPADAELTITSALATPAGATIAGDAIDADNTFTADDDITVVATVTAAFADGAGTLELILSAS